MYAVLFVWISPGLHKQGVFSFCLFFQSLDYDRCINEPYLEVLESQDRKVRPSSRGKVPETIPRGSETRR